MPALPTIQLAPPRERAAEALPLFRRVFAMEARWRELLQRLPAAGLCTRAQVEAILEGSR